MKNLKGSKTSRDEAAHLRVQSSVRKSRPTCVYCSMRPSVVSLGLLFHLWHGSRFSSSHFLTCSQHQSLKYNPMHNLPSNARKRHSNERQHGPSHQATLVAQAVRQERRPQLCLRMASGHCTTCLRQERKKKPVTSITSRNISILERGNRYRSRINRGLVT